MSYVNAGGPSSEEATASGLAGSGAKDKLTTADRVLATLLYLRKLGTRDLIAQLFGVNGSTLTRALQATAVPARACPTASREAAA